MAFRIERNDIANVKADAIVNTANPKPLIGSGTDAMVHAKAGPGLLEARKNIGTIRPGGMRNTAIAVAEEAKKQNAVRIVIGLPKNMDGSEGFRAEAVRAFAFLLAEYTDIPYVFYDERLSTVEAHNFLNLTDTKGKKRKEVVDTLSAQIILQNYLDAN